jgi:hypothetical protein
MIGLGIALGWFLILCGYNFREIQYKNSEQAKKDIFEERRKMIVDALVGEKQIGEVAYHPF